jgi:DNA (cytosine-5)-methyltransferase 1
MSIEKWRNGAAMSEPERQNVVFSFFAGSGLLDLAFEREGFDVCFVNEYFKPFVEAYKHSRTKLGNAEPKYGHHCRSIDDFLKEQKTFLAEKVAQERSLGNLVGFIGGPPCPDFSIGGKNRGKEGENGKLSQSYIDIVNSTEPDWFLFENVKGLWRTRKHREFYEQIKKKIGRKYSLSERLTNSIEAGAPQDRDRILLFGVLKKSGIKNDIDWETGLKFPERSAFDKFDWVDTEIFEENSHRASPNNVPLELTVQHWSDKNEVDKHPNAAHCFTPRGGLSKFQSILEGDVSRKSSKRLHRWRYSPTAAYGNNEVHLHPFKARRISVAEALALQSMPAEFELPADMSLSNMFKTIGNGVPFLLGQHIAKRISVTLQQSSGQKVSKGRAA